MRFVIDTVPADDRITETVVMEDEGLGWGGAKVALIDVSGLLIDRRRPGLLTEKENPVARLNESLVRAMNDRTVKAVVLRINSPGGTVTASALMYDEVMHFKKKTGKPVVVAMGDVAASGGYYLACAGDHVIAHPTTITGSIGVIIQTFNFSEGMQRIGIRADAITSGPNKDMGSPFSPMSPEQRALLQGIVDDFYEDFRAVVLARRPELEHSQVEQITDGRVVTGRHAAELGLVDETGGLRDAFAAAKDRAGVMAARLVKYHRPLEYVGSAYAASEAATPSTAQINLLQLNFDDGLMGETSGFYYLWDPSVW